MLHSAPHVLRSELPAVRNEFGCCYEGSSGETIVGSILRADKTILTMHHPEWIPLERGAPKDMTVMTQYWRPETWYEALLHGPGALQRFARFLMQKIISDTERRKLSAHCTHARIPTPPGLAEQGTIVLGNDARVKTIIDAAWKEDDMVLPLTEYARLVIKRLMERNPGLPFINEKKVTVAV
ncbi:MAG: hypothetical protein HOO67_03830 [Candidatus Peribacteraceae bacterium]|nr:hypothetical protein [Candidatus Peribacteraceae bacterium]